MIYRVLTNICVSLIILQGMNSMANDLHVQKAIDYIGIYRGLHVKDVILLTSDSYNEEISIFYSHLQKNSTTPRLSFILTPKMIASRNSNISDCLFQNLMSQSAVVIRDFEPIDTIERIFSEFEMKKMITVHWLIIVSSNYEKNDDVKDFILESVGIFQRYFSRLLINAKMYAIANVGGIDRLFEVYQICQGGQIVVDELVRFSGNTTNWTNSDYIWEKRSNLRDCPLRVGFFEDPSFLQINSHEMATLSRAKHQRIQNARQTFTANGITMYGPVTEYFSLMQSMLNFSTKWVHVEDKKYGALEKETGEWNGIIGMVRKGHIDTSITEVGITEERSHAVKFTTGFHPYRYSLFMKKPTTNISWNTFLSVFHVTYWWAMAAVLILFSVYLYFLPLHTINSAQETNSVWVVIVKLCNVFSITARAFMTLEVEHQTTVSTRIFITRRMLTLIICTFGMLNFYVYNAGLISSLMVKDYDMPIKGLEDILKKPEYKLLFLEDSGADNFLRYSTTKTYRKIWGKSVKENSRVSSYSDGINQILSDPKKVFFAATPYIEMMFDGAVCDIIQPKITYGTYLYSGYVFHQESPYVELFSHYIVLIGEKGLQTEWFDNQKNPLFECENKGNKYFTSFSYNEVISAFFLLGVSCLVAFGSLLIERGCTQKLFKVKDEADARKLVLSQNLRKLRNLNIKAKEDLSQYQQDLNKIEGYTSKKGESEAHDILSEVQSGYEKIIHLLEKEILCINDE